jgi:endoribonuclease Dicer
MQVFWFLHENNTPLRSAQVIVARRFQTTILSLIISNDHLEVGDSIKNLLEMPLSPGVVYLLLPVVAGKIDWCSIKFSASPMLEATNKDIRRCHSCKDTDFVQTKDGPLCRCTLKNSIVCTPHNGTLYAVSGFLDLNVNSLLHRSDGSVVSYKTHFKTRYELVFPVVFFVWHSLVSCRIYLIYLILHSPGMALI